MKKIISFITLLLFLSTYCFGGTTAVVQVTATVLEGQNSISVDVSLVDFGGVSGSVSNRRFVAGPVRVTYFGATRPWTIRIWTNNNPSAPQAEASQYAGLKGADGATYLPLKVWDDNYGPRNHQIGRPPNEENTYFWRGYSFNGDNDREDIITDGSISEVALGFDVNGDGDALDVGLGTVAEPVSEEPSWLRIPEYNEMIPTNPFTWRRLLTQAWTEAPGPGGGGSGDPNIFPVFFGIDVTGMPPKAYRTTTLTFQIIGE